MEEIKDCVVIGSGPGGLTAAIYLKRFRRDILIIGNEQSRAALIPITHNYPGFPDGISGVALLKRLERQLLHYDLSIINDTVVNIIKVTEGFEVIGNNIRVISKKIVLATGVCDIEPTLPDLKDAVKKGLIRHCPICDGYEIRDQHIGVIGYGNIGMREALFLRTYTPHITLFTLGDSSISGKKLADLDAKGINLAVDPIHKVIIEDEVITQLVTLAGNIYRFDCLYSALGSVIRSTLAISLGAKNINHQLLVSDQQETSIPGLYAVGDIVCGLNQICVATAQGAIAATNIHNSLETTSSRGLSAGSREK